MKGYKAFNKDMICRDMQYEVGQIYEMEGDIECCERGFHFCKNISDVYNNYEMSDDTRMCKVHALGEVVTDGCGKYCTNKIKIVEEIKNNAEKHCNIDKSTNGFCNTGYNNSGNRNSGSYNSGDRNTGKYNSGDRNTGCCNSGSRNSGDKNSGLCNTGYRNSGDYNSGDRNSGDDNTGKYNSGNFNTGFYNSGSRNTGFYNIGDNNTGYHNTGDKNSGNCNMGSYNTGYDNTGKYNSGNHNSGIYNSGSYNSGNHNSGFCNTTNAKVRMFNHETDMDFDDERIDRFTDIMVSMPHSYKSTDFITERYMTAEEKESHPEYKTLGGFIRTINIEANKWKWWTEEVSEEDKEFIKSLPYYDEDVFFESTGIKADMDKTNI